MQSDGELRDLEQPADELPRRVRQVEREVGQRVQQFHVRFARSARFCLVGRVELGNLSQRAGLLCFQVVVGAT
ncbi:hypothetical protein AOZ06_41445 [Kibdelosporangium phytohabitans]|uniref:Uncharacterized protein n=1 Tax=Kibdelosporangium phytohabitans TaxID=860235 RepID=A0A0N9I858_9PSEU|nr:hypothetical protein AOZ06_41445 [Kibdelosporangium phytohabitans]